MNALWSTGDLIPSGLCRDLFCPFGAVRRVDVSQRRRVPGPRARRGATSALIVARCKVHRVRVGIRQHQPGADAARRADGAEDVGPVATKVTWCGRAAALLGLDLSQAALLADTGFVLQPELDRLAAGFRRDAPSSSRESWPTWCFETSKHATSASSGTGRLPDDGRLRRAAAGTPTPQALRSGN